MNVDGKAVQDNGQDTSPDTRSDLGLLFIHGIGRQRQGQTLTGWLDPLCDWMRNWLSGAARYATSCGVTKEELSAAFPYLDSEAKQLLDAARVPDKPRTIGRRGLNNADLHFLTGTVELDAATITSTNATPNARVRLKAIHKQGNLITASITVAEAFWQKSFPKPTWKETTDWLLRIVPCVVLLHFGNPARDRCSKIVRRYRESGPYLMSRQRAKLAGDCVLLLFDMTRLLVATFVLPVIQLLLLFLATFGWLPIPGYSHILAWVQEIISSILGDAYIFTSSPTRLAAVVTQARKSLDWLSATSRKVIIVAHSQGAAVAYHVLNSENPPVVGGLVTLGSGLKKLHFLQNLRNEHDVPITFMINYSLALGGVSMAYLLAGHDALLPPWLEGGTGIAYIFIFLSTLVSLMASLLPISTDEIKNWWKSRGGGSDLHWLDVYASHDPVSDGPLFEARLDGIESQQVTNQGSLIADHTAYWENVDEFVATVGTWMSKTADLPIPLHALNNDDAGLLQHARTARLWRVRFLRFWRWTVYGAAILVAAAGLAPTGGRAINQAIGVHISWLLAGPRGSGQFLGLSHFHLGLLVFAIGAYLVQLLTNGFWRMWTNSETKDFCSREPDINGAVVSAVLCSAPSAVVAGLAVEVVFPGYGVVMALPFFVFNGLVIRKMYPG